ncbi:hypothetical protein GCM10020219_043170 [Nonomuraea dietziae]
MVGEPLPLPLGDPAGTDQGEGDGGDRRHEPGRREQRPVLADEAEQRSGHRHGDDRSAAPQDQIDLPPLPLTPPALPACHRVRLPSPKAVDGSVSQRSDKIGRRGYEGRSRT